MIRLTKETPKEQLINLKKGDMVTDGFSKTGIIESISIDDDGLYLTYTIYLSTDRIIQIKK